MNPASIRRSVAMGLASFGLVTVTVGGLTDNEGWMVIGFMHLIMASFWAFGEGSTKP